MKLAKLPVAKYNNEYFSFKGGLDLTTPPILIPPGFARESLNYEEGLIAGYSTLSGYERFNGTAKPSSALLFSLPYIVLGTLASGQLITGSISGATARIVMVLPNTLIITNVVGAFTAETLVGASGATVQGPVKSPVLSKQDRALYKKMASDLYRSLIPPVPGVGSILGVWYYDGNVYAFRNSALTGVGMYKSSPTGWQAVTFGVQVNFIAGSGTPPTEGSTITKGASSAVLKRLVIESGTFAAGTAAGRLIFNNVVGGAFTSGAFTSGITGSVVSQINISIPNQNGRFEFVNTTFTGSMSDYRMYGVDGVNNAFEFDGLLFVPIVTPLDVTRKPSHLAVHQNQLFLSYESSVINSNIGSPYGWSTTGGSAEIAVGDRITGFKVQPGSNTTPSMSIFCRNHTHVLYGSSPADFQLIPFNDDQGAIPYSIQKVHHTYYLDDRGVTSMEQAQEYGNFIESTLSFKVTPLLSTKRNRVTDSHVSRDKQQYRLFFNDGSGIYFKILGNEFSAMPVRFPDPVLCSVSSEIDGGGEELIFFGSTSGYVYQMESGTSFDGKPIDTSLTLVFNNSKSYRGLKKYRHLTLEIATEGQHDLQLGYDLSYRSDEAAQPDNELINISVEIPKWDSFVWDNFTWDGDSKLFAKHIAINGNGQNLAVKLKSSGTTYNPINISGCFLEYSNLRMLR